MDPACPLVPPALGRGTSVDLAHIGSENCISVLDQDHDQQRQLGDHSLAFPASVLRLDH